MKPHRDYYHRRLPHLQPLNGTFFVTYRLYGSVPIAVQQQIQNELAEEHARMAAREEAVARAADLINRRYFGRYDAYLDNPISGPMYLADRAIARLVADSLHHYDETRIDLMAYCIMSNHVHVVFTLLGEQTGDGSINSLTKLIRSIKSFSGRRANAALALSGPFWESEWYDRCVRDNDELIRIVRYVLNNPVKAGLCAQWQDWPWSYIKPEYDMF